MRIEKEGNYLFAHRGYSKDLVENTLEAFDLCRKRGIPGVELDVHLTLDGKVVVAHDFSLEHTAGIKKNLEEMSFPEIEQVNVGAYKQSNGRIPMLSELFSSFGDDLYYDIEIKDNGIKDIGLEQKLWEVIKAAHIEQQCVISSFNPLALRRFRHASAHAVDVGLIYFSDPTVPKFLHHGRGRFLVPCDFLKPTCSEVDAALMKHLSGRYPIIPWPVDSKEESLRLKKLGVAGVISNDPLKASDEFGKQ